MIKRILQPSLMRQIVLLSIIMLVTLFVAFFITDRVAKQIIERKVTDTVDKIFLQVQEKFTSFNNDMQGISTFLFYSPTVQNYMKSNDSLSRVLMSGELLSMFANTSSMKSNIRGIQLFDLDGKLLARIGEGEDNTSDRVAQITYSGVRVLKNRSTEHFYTIKTPVYGVDNNIATEYKGTGVYVMDANNFKPILHSAQITPNSIVLLLDHEDRSIASEGLKFDENVNLSKWENNRNYIVQSKILPQSNWKLISIIPKRELLSEMDSIQRINIATYLTMFGLLSLFLLIFLTRIVRPIRSLMEFMKSYPKNGENSRYDALRYRNEIGALGIKLNKMLDDIGSLSAEVQETQAKMYKIELVKKQMEISAFRNQINPHFLYNTLEGLRAMAMYYEVKDIAEISESLSRLFRYAVKGSNFVTLDEEISYVNEYAKIIDFRFRGRFHIIVDCDEELRGETTLKMILQPIVENAVFHGLERKVGNGTVTITIRRSVTNDVLVRIEDDGRGINDERLKELLANLSIGDEMEFINGDLKGIGILNIFKRIKLFYGDAAGMTIQSKLGSGTQVNIWFPNKPES